MRDGTAIAEGRKYQGVGTPMLTIVDAHKEDEGAYSCLIANELGNATSQNSLLSIGT